MSRPGMPIGVRRLFTDAAGTIVAMETQSRTFTAAQRAFVKLRDQWCSTPYCGAPIMQIDHVEPYSRGGATSLMNAQGLCESCNRAKSDSPQATTRTAPDIAYPIRITVVAPEYRHPRRSRAPATRSG